MLVCVFGKTTLVAHWHLVFMVKVKFILAQYQIRFIKLNLIVLYCHLELSLNTPNATDTINDPYNTCVQFYAAYLAKYYEQSYGESEIYKQEYTKHINSVINTVYTRRVPSVYSSPM